MIFQFNGSPLIEIPAKIPTYNVLCDKFGEEFLDKYNKIVESDFNNHPLLKCLSLSKYSTVEGSNAYSVVLANRILNPLGLRTVNPVDIQKIIDSNNIPRFNCYFTVPDRSIDLGLLLTDANDSFIEEQGAPRYLANQLGKQAKKLRYKFSDENPLFLKPSDLELSIDNNSPNGLGFKIKKTAKLCNAPQFIFDNDYKKFNKTNKQGFPIFDKDGEREFYFCSFTRSLNRLSFNELNRLSLECYNLSYSSDKKYIMVAGETK
ncbi:hypothetical protein M0R19_00565 [Candidatus Pacearchaeota archaeon]|jgi:hypothetical protein|nr:hypothetical protein [Candidatus Pacearchaeota archaeon]